MWVVGKSHQLEKKQSLDDISSGTYSSLKKISFHNNLQCELFSFLGRKRHHHFENNDAQIIVHGLCHENNRELDLESFLNRFIQADQRNKKLLYHSLSGHFTVLIIQQDQIFFLTDPMGVGCFYYHNLEHVFSSSLMIAAYYGNAKTPSAQGCYETVFSGAVHGSYTSIENIHKIYGFGVYKNDRYICIDSGISAKYFTAPNISDSLKDQLLFHKEILENHFHHFLSSQKNKPLLLLSAGFDSRLILALLLQGGYDFELQYFDQGNACETNIIHQLAQYSGKKLDYVNKRVNNNLDDVNPVKDLWIYDGAMPDSGVFSNGQDTLNRLARSENNLLLNGSLGEIYRNFFYLGDHSFTALQLVDQFYSQYDPDDAHPDFHNNNYRSILASNIARLLGGKKNTPLSRPEIEMIYPLYRGRHWTAQDLKINLKFGDTLYPFILPEVLQHTAFIPMKYKNMGILEGEMIAQIDPKLADISSSYGYSFSKKRPMMASIYSRLNMMKPFWFSRNIWRMRNHYMPSNGARPVYLQENYLKNYIDIQFPHTQSMFQHKVIKNHNHYNAVATLELLFKTLH